MMAAFAGYGFPKAHAASYARVSWRSAWCKTHFPAEFMAAVLANWGGYYNQRVYLNEARRMGLVTHPPHVNYSGRNFRVVHLEDAVSQNRDLFMGLDQVRDLTRRTIERIMRFQPFRSLDDFLSRVDPRLQEAESLTRVGALGGFGTIPSILERLSSGNWQAGQPGLFEWSVESAGDWTVEQKVAAQQDILGISLAAHPLELLAGKLASLGAVTTLDAAGRVGERVTVAGIRLSSHRSRTAKGAMMMFLSIEDLAGMLDVIVFPDVYQRSRDAISSSKPLLISGVVELDPSRGEPLLRADRVSRL
jgi:DNA polymerase III alpha subunit